MSFKENKWPFQPKILEINAWQWLTSLSEEYNQPITLATVPEEIFDKKFKYFDAIWLMGVWERSPKGKAIANSHPGLIKEYQNALNDFNSERDVVGSPYAIHAYDVDKNLGGNKGLVIFRENLKNRHLFLILDHVPNHVAIDHEWTLTHPEIFIQGTEEDLISQPYDFYKVKEWVYAHGKDPYFPPWTDTVQINAFSPKARELAIKTILKIAQLCDGVRCDMAMLVMSNIFHETWGEKAGSCPRKEFWSEIISMVRKNTPNFKFIAEAYWNTEWELMQQGFDLVYDKKLYDRLLHDSPSSVREYLRADWDYQVKLLRFIENHDEQRAIKAFGKEKSKAAAFIILTLPGAKLIHDGQMEGNQIKIPVQLGRKPREALRTSIYQHYQLILENLSLEPFISGNWNPCEAQAINTINRTNENIISYTWFTRKERVLLVINYSSYPSQCHLRIPNINFGHDYWIFEDIMNGKSYKYKGEDLQAYGLYIDLNPWNAHFFKVYSVE
ncbi:MAG: alpha-amylase family glycosyl hydrolase [Promethearchaeota archaeon]